MTPALRVVPVLNKSDLLRFVQFPFGLYRDDPNWVPPFIEERRDFFDPAKNPFFEHARCQLFLAYRGDSLVGTVGAVVDDNHNRVHQERMGAFGFFETIDDREVSDALLEAAEQWARSQGMTIMRGPLNFSVNHEIGMLVDGFDSPPFVMMTHNPRYYPALVENCGYAKAMDLYAYLYDIAAGLAGAPAKLFRAAEKATKNAGLHIRPIDMHHFDRELAIVKDVYNRAWEQNWGAVPMTEHEMDHLARGLKPLLDPALVFVAENANGEPAGVSLALPDVHQALRWSGGGHMWPLGLPKFLWHRRHINRGRVLILGTVEEYRGRGIDAYFTAETARRGLERGYQHMECSWILETNAPMNLMLQRLGGDRHKTYRIYERTL
jgi:GNAT superfamily N-acetyltransferase